MVKKKVARRNSVRAIHTQREGRTSKRRTKNTALICENVLALPKILGLKFLSPAIANRTVLAARIDMSRLKTTTVNFQGILCRMERTRNKVLSRSLSAMGSRYWPSKV